MAHPLTPQRHDGRADPIRAGSSAKLNAVTGAALLLQVTTIR